MELLHVGSGAYEGLFDHVNDLDYIALPDVVPVLLGECTSTRPLSGDKYVGYGDPYGKVMEIEVAWPGSTGAELLELVGTHGLVDCADEYCANKDVLLTLKLSHLFKASPHFNKTRKDILTLRQAGATVPAVLQDWLKRREKETLAYHVHPKLNQNSTGFFRPDEVPYKYVHDTIHLAMAYGAEPAYKAFQADGAEVKVDKTKWDALPLPNKLHSVLEESYVLALERHQIPNDFSPDPQVSFAIALEKVCTTIASGWWREFAWEHYDEALSAGQAFDYVGKFRLGLAQGIVQPFVKERV